MSLYNTNFIANINGVNQDLGNIFYNWSSNTINIASNEVTAQRYSITYKKPTIILETDIIPSMDGYASTGDQVITFGPQLPGQFVFMGSGTNGAAFMDDAININYLGTANIASNTSSGIFWDGTKWFGNTSGGGSATANIISYDGIYWQSTGTTNASAGGWTWKAYFNGSIYLLINGGRANAAAVSYSYDGINWTAVSSLPMTTYAVGWNGLVWLVGGTVNTTIYYSYDGITWISTGQAPFSSGLRGDIIWTGNRWVVSGNNGGSSNQIFFTTNPLGTSGWTASSNSGTNETAGLCWNNKILTVINSVGLIMNSTDATAFTSTSTSAGGSGIVRWNGRTFVVMSTNNVFYSYNGIQWVSYPITSAPGFCNEYNHRRVNTITFQRRLAIAAGTGTNTLAFSLDGITWVGLGTSIFNSSGSGIAYNGKIWVAVGSTTNTIAYSYNGYNWVGLGANIFTTIGVGVAWNGTMFVAVGRGTNTIAYSYDGMTWLTSTTSNIIEATGGGISISWSGKLWVAGGGNTGGNTLAYSADGINWTGILSSASGGINSIVRTVATNGQLFIGGGDATGLNYSYNGITWVSIGTSVIHTLRGVAWNGSMWVALGTDSAGTTGRIGYSYNGLNWISATSPFATTGLCVNWNGTMWVAGGQGTNTLAYSYNGITWIGAGATIVTTNVSGIGTNFNVNPKPYIQHPTVAFGEGSNTIAYSPDGIVWKPLGNTVFTSAGEKTFWNGKLWVGVGIGGNTLAYSFDGYNWVGLGRTVFSTAGYSVTFNGSIWVAVGSGGNTIGYSSNGTQWTGVTGSSSIFTISGTNVAWNGRIFLATGTGTNAAATSSNGITWAGVSALTSYAAEGLSGVVSNGAYWQVGTNKYYSNVGILYTTDRTAQTGWNTANLTLFTGTPTIVNVAGTGLPTAPHEWAAEQQAMSQSGQYIVLAAYDTYTETTRGKVFYSTNYGRTFTQSTGLPLAFNARAPAISDNGQFAVVFNPLPTPTVWRSTDYGATFSQISSNTSTYYLNNSAISNDGNTIYMTSLGGAGLADASLYKTSNANLGMSATWSRINPSGGLQVLSRIECSSDGSIVLVGGRLGLYRSTDGGSTWANLADGTRGLPASSGTNYWVAVTMTRDGTKMLVAAQNNSVYTSTNSGTSFTVVSGLTATNWITAAISSDGTHMALGNDTGSGNGLAYWSTNSGSTWTSFAASSNRLISTCRIQNGILLFTTGNYANQTNDNNVYIARLNSCSSIIWNGSRWVACCNTIPLAHSTNGTSWTTITNSGFIQGVNDLCWNGRRFVATGGNYMGYSNDGVTWYSSLQSSIFSNSGYGIASNSGVGAFVAPSAMVIDDNGISGNGIANSRTLEFVSSDPYFQTGFNNISVKVETKTIL